MALASGYTHAVDQALKRVLSALGEMAETSEVWPQGLLNAGGPHRRLKGHQYPISIGEDECAVFGKLIEAFRPAHCYIIGNAFGLSSAYIAEVMKDHGGERVITLDNQSEGDGEKMAAIARGLADKLELGAILENKKGSAPRDIAGTVEQQTYQLIFIDGLHRHPQVTHDLEGMLPYANEATLIVFHDSWIVGVPEAVAEAKKRGHRCLWIPTSCEMIVATRDEAAFEKLQALFPDGVEDRGRRSYVYGYLLHLKEVFSFQMSRLRGQQ